MTNQEKKEILQLLAVASELTGTSLTDNAINYMLRQLDTEPFLSIKKSLEKIIKSGKKFTYADVINFATETKLQLTYTPVKQLIGGSPIPDHVKIEVRQKINKSLAKYAHEI